jgi:hypothetical protein
MAVSCLVSPSALKMDAICYSKTSYAFQWTTKCTISQNIDHFSRKAMLASLDCHNIVLPVAGVDNCEYTLVKGICENAPARG